MSVAEHGPWREDIGAYLLEALPAGERERFEAHLEACHACREEVDFLRVASDALPASVEQLVPPPELRRRIMAVVEAEAELLAAAAGPRADRPEPARRPRRRFRLPPLHILKPALLATATALVFGVALGTVLEDNASSERSVVVSVDETQARNAEGRLVVRDRVGRLELTGMPVPPAGRVYQVWLVRASRDPVPTSSLFVPRSDGTSTVSVPSLRGVDQVLVTDEPVGGSRAPTRTPLVAASPA